MKIYRGIVVDNKDPNGGGRVKVRIAGVHPLPKNFGDGNYETKDGELDAEINFYDDPNDSSVADIYLRGDSFTEYLSRYCGAK